MGLHVRGLSCGHLVLIFLMYEIFELFECHGELVDISETEVIVSWRLRWVLQLQSVMQGTLMGTSGRCCLAGEF